MAVAAPSLGTHLAARATDQLKGRLFQTQQTAELGQGHNHRIRPGQAWLPLMQAQRTLIPCEQYGFETRTRRGIDILLPIVSHEGHLAGFNPAMLPQTSGGFGKQLDGWFSHTLLP